MKTKSGFLTLLTALSLSLNSWTGAGESRTWTSNDGKTIEAEYLSATDIAVKVRMGNREVEIPLDRLSKEDHEWVAAAVAKENEPTPIEGPYADLVTGDWAPSAHGSLPFVLYGSKDFDAKKKYPLVVSLHGKSQNNENGKQVGFARAFTSPENFDARPCFILAPLCYQPYGATGGGWSDKPGEETVDLVKKLVESLPIDANRVYVIGYSMGGFGVCHLMAGHPDLFAGGVAVAGYGWGDHVGKLKKEPLWLFHAADDPVVEVAGSRQFAEELDRSDVFQYTEWETGGHGIIGKVTEDKAVHEWLFSQRND